ncbi:GNAT family N-acetyltransferase [Devosia sp. 2618]|uniref:GNAT family N-acetyltransferase n=1 Tax=Devosia sp. 2618 TaxID=3156454 RepID=UPI003399E116
MSTTVRPHLRLRKRLDTPIPAPVWPPGITPERFDAVEPSRIHAVLEAAFPGLVAAREDWYGNLTTDSEFDPALCVPAITEDGQVAGFVQCWTGDFIKDLAVAPQFRGKGLGAALMLHVFGLFAARGSSHVDLKVETEEQPARRLYARLGMVEV